MGRTAFVTGATGFVGLNLVEHLVRSGWTVTAMHRETSNLEYLRRFGPKLAVGAVTDARSVVEAMPRGVDCVFHVAGNTSFWSRNDEIQTRVNVDGTRNVVRAALERGAGRLVHTSSDSAYGVQTERMTEKTRSTAPTSWINYFRTKWLAEQEVREGISEGLDAVLVNPTNILGPYDFHNWSRMIAHVDAGKVPAVPPGSGSWCHVREVARAHASAFERGRTGDNYLLAGTDASFLEVLQTIAEVLGRTPPRRAVRPIVVRVYARVGDWISRFTGREPEITPELAVTLTSRLVADSSKAERELGYRPVPLREMIEDAVRWMRDEGRLG